MRGAAMSLHAWPAGRITLGSNLNDDCPDVDNLDARLVLDGYDVRIDVPLDLGELGDTVMHIELAAGTVHRCARLMLARTYRVGESVYDHDAGFYATVREEADSAGALLVAGRHGQYRISAAHISRPPTVAEDNDAADATSKPQLENRETLALSRVRTLLDDWNGREVSSREYEMYLELRAALNGAE